MMRQKSRRAEGEALAQIRKAAGVLQPGSRTTGLRCPVCGGGRTGEKSFGISLDSSGVAFYRCFRARCGVRGALGTPDGNWLRDTSLSGIRNVSRKPMETPNLQGLEGSLWGTRLHDKYGLDPGEADWADWGVANKGGSNESLFIPVVSPDKVRRGYEVKAYTPSSYGGKSRSFRSGNADTDGAWASYYPRRSSGSDRPLVVCEDSISALKVSRHADCYCLIGTHISTDKGLEINDLSVGRRALLCLDRDATDTAADTCKRLRWTCPSLVLTPIRKDLKYYSDAELLELLDV
jgi:hypothetical protein